MARRTRSRKIVRALPRKWAAVLLIVLVAGLAAWWEAGQWKPSRQNFPVQGVLLREGDGPQQWPLVKGAGADFAYIVASRGASGANPDFPDSLTGARGVGLQVGAVHRFDPCRTATEQSRNFVVVVPRLRDLLPPAVWLTEDDEACPAPPSEGAVESELMTFLNQIEAHVGKPAILLIDRGFEKRYHLAGTIDRNVWVTGDYLAPGYAGRPWVMWTANDRLRNPAGKEPMRWVVVRP